MKTKIIIIIIYVLLISCNGQKKEAIKPINNTIVMKKIDSIYLNKIKEIGEKNQKIQLIENDTIVELTDMGVTYHVIKRKNNENIKESTSYFKNSLSLLYKGAYFYDIPIGIHRKYSEKGELVYEENYDKNFPFSVYELIDKIKTENQIDLNDTTKIKNVSRNFDESLNRNIYMIIYKNDKSDEKERSKLISVDGKTGEILSNEFLKINMR